MLWTTKVLCYSLLRIFPASSMFPGLMVTLICIAINKGYCTRWKGPDSQQTKSSALYGSFLLHSSRITSSVIFIYQAFWILHESSLLESSDDGVLPFKMARHQFPVRPGFAMTINKSQGQTFDHVGIDLEQEVFGHGQLYVAFSRATSATGVRIIMVTLNTLLSQKQISQLWPKQKLFTQWIHRPDNRKSAPAEGLLVSRSIRLPPRAIAVEDTESHSARRNNVDCFAAILFSFFQIQ
uniref:UvrD_C_2 domain-containing protein n=1 Tax=Steinernema glaseri TaxID=37863 RepID=A0A1I7XY17_9BILA